MKALVIIHIGYEPDDDSYKLMKEHTEKVERHISAEIKKFLEASQKVYYLEDSSCPIMPPEIKKYEEHMIILDNKPSNIAQFLKTKVKMMEDNITHAFLVGGFRDSCVRHVDSILSGEISDLRSLYRTESKKLGWDKDMFNTVCDYKIKIIILEGLTF